MSRVCRVALVALALTACSQSALNVNPDGAVPDGAADGPPAPLACDDSLKSAYQRPNTTVLLVHAFAKGDALALADTPATPAPPIAQNDLCLVKLNVGPGNPGPAPACPSSCPGASCPACTPSTSPGIGLEIWLPSRANWNQRIHNLGGMQWAGGDQGSTMLIGAPGAAIVAGVENAVSGTTDTGHAITDGSFAMNPDGSIDTALWTDFADRSLHELAVQTRALAAAYYQPPLRYAYWEGCSTGGRQGYTVAQNHATDYNGYLIGAPAINWTRFETGGVYAQVVIQRDLIDSGLSLTTAQEDFVSRAAVRACDVVAGQHLGYLLDPRQCHYDPAKDSSVLCTAPNTPANCVTPEQAAAIDKFWYGQTSDGSAPDPAADNGTAATLAANQLWFSQTRGTDLTQRATANMPFTRSTDILALELQNPAYADPTFFNATGSGTNLWTTLSYTQLANASAQGLTLQSSFGNINTDNADLSAVRDSGAKILHYHGLADPLITPLGSIYYYSLATAKMGGAAAIVDFDRLYLIPGMGHCNGSGTVKGLGTNDMTLPLPGAQQLFNRLTDWVENGEAPGAIVLQSQDQKASRPICVFPRLAVYTGPNPAAAGDLNVASNYTCQ